MFQMFAAKMFEQRVLAAYREKVALENQRKLLQEVKKMEENVVDFFLGGRCRESRARKERKETGKSKAEKRTKEAGKTTT